jgi:hypothetical protein
MLDLPSRANFEPAYKPQVGRPSKPATDVTFIIVPDFWARKWGSAAWIRRRGPKKLVSI